MADFDKAALLPPQAAQPWFDGSEWTHRLAADILMYGPISRTGLARLHSLSQGTVSRITADLIYDGVITSTDEENSHSPVDEQDAEDKDSAGRGRPQTNLRIIDDANTFVGINLRGEVARAMLVNTSCKQQGSVHEEYFTDTTPENVTRSLAKLISQCCDEAKSLNLPTPRMVGVSIGGHIMDDGTVDQAPFLAWNHRVDLGGMVSELTNIPCYIFNNLDSLLRYQQWFGAGIGETDFAIVTVGAGVGYGLVSGGEVVQAPGESYGLAGHILIDPDGPACLSGRRHRGCSQCLTNDSLAQEYSEMMGSPKTFDDYAHDVEQGVPQAKRLVQREAFRMGALLAVVANMAMPRTIFISGESCSILKYAMESIRMGLAEYRPSRAPEVEFSILQDDDSPWMMGAATEAIRLFVLGPKMALRSALTRE